MEARILLLRPFWESAITAEYIRRVHGYTRYFGRLVAIRNGDEPLHVRLDPTLNPWRSRGALAGWLYDRLNPSLNVEFLSATDETWQAKVIEQIGLARAVILHLAPRQTPDTQAFPDIRVERRFVPIQKPEDFDEAVRTDVHEAGTGQGLLRELDYCRQAGALAKTIVLVPDHFMPRIQAALSVVNMGHGIDAFELVDGGVRTFLPKVSTLDHALANLQQVWSVIPYRRFGGPVFGGRLLRALNDVFAAPPAQSAPPCVGIPPEPIPLPPDGKLKHIRFTPVERLTKIPVGRLVELSFEEVAQIQPEWAADPNCPSCGSGPERIFWYQKEASPDLTPGATIVMLCQYCGYKDWR